MAEDAIRIKCPSLVCRKILAVPVSSRGKTVKCKSCGGMIRVPYKQAASAASEQAAPPAPKSDAA